MASDLKFDIFASKLFGTYWHETGLISEKIKVSLLYPEEYLLDPENADIYEDSHYTAVFFKHVFYHCIFYDELRKLQAQFEPSPSYISDYISRTCRRDDLFGDLSIFELLLTSCAFVADLSYFCITTLGYKDVLRYVHVCWAMYFDEYKEQFYKQGGWSQLKIVSVSYVLPNEFLSPYPKAIFHSHENRIVFILDVMKALDNYKSFTSHIHDNCKTISKAWVRYHLPNFNKSVKSIVTADVLIANDLRDPKVVEKFLLHIRRLCGSNVTEVLNVNAHHKITDSCKQYNEEVHLSSLKLNNLTLNDVTASTSNTEDKQRENGLTFQKRPEQTDKLIEFYSQNKNTTSNASENDALRNNPFLKFKMTSGDHISRIKIPGTSGQKPNEDTLKETDLERERSEANNLLRRILVLGHPE